MNAKEYKFDIIIQAGQSNAQGNGMTTPDRQYKNDEVFQLSENGLTLYGYGLLDYSGKGDFEIEPAAFRKSEFRILEDFSEPFADLYINNGFLEKGRNVLIIKAAVGGTGFSLSQWGVKNVLHKRLVDMIDYALSLNPENRLVAFLWHQGEHDAFEQPELNASEREEFYYNAFKATLEDIRRRYNVCDLPVIAGEFAEDWSSKNKVSVDAVQKATKRVCADVGYAAVASSKGLKSNAQANSWSADDIHFCADAIEELGKRYFELYKTVR